MRKTTHNKRYDIPLGRAIYVDQTNGVDTNNGSASQPLKTIATVNGLKLRPNDKIMFKRGESWTEKLKSTIDGKPNNFITYGAYGSGALPKVTCPAGEDNAFGTVDALGMPHNFSGFKTWNL